MAVRTNGTSLLATLAGLWAEVREADTERVVALLAVTITNGPEIAACYGTRWLDLVTEEVVSRLRAATDARVLPEDPWGGLLVAVSVDRDVARTQIAALAEAMRGMVDLDHDQVWPVVTVRARELDGTEDVWGVARGLRSSVWEAGRQAPGTLTWQPVGEEAPRASGTGGTTDELLLARDLAVCLSERPEDLDLAFQPVHDLQRRVVVGAEALLRWTHPARGPVSAASAVAAAERTGLVRPLGRLVLDRALAHLARWQDRLGPDFVLHVNVSPLELHDPGYVDHLEAALQAAGVAPRQLMLELTETALAEGPDVAATLRAISTLGVRLGVDDFGIGYSSIALVGSMCFDAVKIDRSLVRDIATDQAAFATARAVLALVSTLGVIAVAEGIEDALQATHLRSMGCRYAQGYHLGRPTSAEALWGDERDPTMTSYVGACPA